MMKRSADSSLARAALCLWVFCVCASAAAFAQAGMGSISGLITDSSGAAVPGTKVVAQNRASGIKSSTVSNAAGVYSFVSLAPAPYDLSATQKGFGTVLEKNVLVTLDQVTPANISLRVGKVDEVVTVTE